jgi:hypothetical protein
MFLQSDLSVVFDFGSLNISGCFSADVEALKRVCASLSQSGALSPIAVSAIRDCIVGKYVVQITRNADRVWINDLVSSYRHYINDHSGEVVSDFTSCYMESQSVNQSQLKRIYKKGYTQGHRTILEGISKFHPAAVYYQNSKEQVVVPPTESVSKITAEDINKYYMRYFESLKTRRVGIAFSGGLDSLYLVHMCLKNGIQPVLYHLNLTPNDKDASEDLLKASKSAALLKLPLNIIELNRQSVFEKVSFYIQEHINDISFSFVALREFIKEIDREGHIDVLLTGQNSDSFINFGVTRANHPIEALLLFFYKKIFPKLFYHDRIGPVSRFLLRIGYSLRRIPVTEIPRSKVEFVGGLESDFHYFPCVQATGPCDLPKYSPESADNYFRWMLCNKLTNHIGGNHSVVWSDDRTLRLNVLMPFSEGFFLQMGMQQMASMSAILEPKKILKQANMELSNTIQIANELFVDRNLSTNTRPKPVGNFTDLSEPIDKFILGLKLNN